MAYYITSMETERNVTPQGHNAILSAMMRRYETLYAWLLAIIFGGVVLHAPLSVGLGVLWPDAALLIKSWKELLMVPAAVLAVILVSRRGMWRELGRDWIFRLIVAYAVIHVVTVGLLYQGAAATMAGLAIDLRYVLFFSLVYVLIRLRPEWRMPLIVTGAIGAMVVVAFGVVQLFLPADILKHIGYSAQTIAPYMTVDQNESFVRINSTLRGPNPLGAYMVIVLAVMGSLLLLERKRLTSAVRRSVFGAMTLGSLVVLYVTYSRAAAVGAAVALTVIFMVVMAKRWSWRVWLAIGVAGLLLVGGLWIARDVPVVSTVILHEDPHEGGEVNSNDEHARSLREGTDRLLAQPFGAGVGTTGSASIRAEQGFIIENQYLFVAHEVGWAGLAMFFVLFGWILTRLWQGRADWLALAVGASGIGLALIGILLPVWADDTVSIVWWGLAAIALATPLKKENE